MQAWLLVSLLAAQASAVMLSCEHVRVDKQSFNLEKLGGPHSVVTTLREPPSHSNTTYTVDICKPLKRKGADEVPKEEQCPNGTRGVFPPPHSFFLRACFIPPVEYMSPGFGALPVIQEGGWIGNRVH